MLYFRTQRQYEFKYEFIPEVRDKNFIPELSVEKTTTGFSECHGLSEYTGKYFSINAKSPPSNSWNRKNNIHVRRENRSVWIRNRGFSQRCRFCGRRTDTDGKSVRIDHENGFYTLYGHCSLILVTKGMKVKRGDKIALVGATGKATGPHLHYEVHIGMDPPVDPKEFINID
ncbi:MAG: M23 family metallopeptidase [Leptospira sp.]|nr:M23 family metallopeptidase [Leptospira sp.]